MNTFDNSGHLNEESVSLYVDALMTDNIDIIPEQIIEHVEHCARCKKEIIEVIDIMKEAKGFAEKKQDTTAKSKTKSRLNKSFLMAILLLVLGYVFMNLNSDKTGNTIVKHEKHPVIGISNQAMEMGYTSDDGMLVATKEPVKQNVKAHHKKAAKPLGYKESFNLESLVETNFRSSSVTVVTPRKSQYYAEGAPISFNFVNTISKTLFIKILNNKEENVFTTDFRGNCYEFRHKLQPGLYYWKLETEDDLLYIGKFIVN